MSRKTFCCFILFLLIVFSASSCVLSLDVSSGKWSQPLNLGAIVDLTSRAGKEERVAIQIAIEDFYINDNSHPILHVKNSRGNPIRALSSANSLIKRNHVKAIVGLGTWRDAAFIAEVGNKSEVPILSLANDVPSWACLHWPFLVNAAHSQFSQMKAVAAIVRSWQWRKVNIIYEDVSSDVSGIIPYLISALQDVGSEISDLLPLPPVRSHYSLSEKLKHLKNGQCRVFIVHTSATLGTNIFREAKKLEMMEKEFVWITTEAITNLMDTFNASVISSMQGVLGVKSYFSRSGEHFKHFQSKFRRKFHFLYSQESYLEPGIYALQAYDAMWALAMAMEGIPYQKSYRNSSKVSISGKKLLGRILLSNFEGLAGVFKFRKRILSPAHIFRIVNVVGKSYGELGYWTESLGFSKSINLGSKYNKSMTIVGQVFWPGGPWSVPRGWALPTKANPLMIGVPMSNTHKEFIKVIYDENRGNVTVDGFSIDVFKAALKFLSYDLPHEFVPFNGTYDSLVEHVKFQIFDAVVADTAIVAKRYEYAEFSQPYADSGLQMLTYAKDKSFSRTWLFTKPFTPGMWIATGFTNVYIGAAVWWIERKDNPLLRSGTKWKQIGAMLSSAFITLFSLKGDEMNSNLSRIVMVAWLFLALVITQSFTASLTSLITVPQLGPALLDVETLRQSGAKVGCDGNSFVVKYLEGVLKFRPENIVRIYSEDDYSQALISGEIAAAFLEVPYVKVFLAKHCNEFTTSGPIFKVGGFGFVFPKSYPYLPDISQAVVRVAETGELKALEDSLTASYKCSASKSDDDHERLEFNSFFGLFVIIWTIPAAALLLFFLYPYLCEYQCVNWLFNDRHQQPDLQQGQQPQQLDLQQHDFQTDEHFLFAAEMENQVRRL